MPLSWLLINAACCSLTSVCVRLLSHTHVRNLLEELKRTLCVVVCASNITHIQYSSRQAIAPHAHTHLPFSIRISFFSPTFLAPPYRLHIAVPLTLCRGAFQGSSCRPRCISGHWRQCCVRASFDPCSCQLGLYINPSLHDLLCAARLRVGDGAVVVAGVLVGRDLLSS